MQIGLVLTIILVLTMSVWFFYTQYQKKNRQSLLDLSKRLDWVEPVLEMQNEALLEEHIVEEIVSPILSSADSKSIRQISEVPLNYGRDVLALYIMASKGNLFQGYELLQTISINNFRYGKMQIFHYYENSADFNSPIVMSLANAVEPGFFNLNEMGTFSSPGLVLFMQLDEADDLMERFYFMLETAKQLADDLGGEVLDDARKPFDANSDKIYRQRLGAVAA
jgi:cell division protein ZipA